MNPPQGANHGLNYVKWKIGQHFYFKNFWKLANFMLCRKRFHVKIINCLCLLKLLELPKNNLSHKISVFYEIKKEITAVAYSSWFFALLGVYLLLFKPWNPGILKSWKALDVSNLCWFQWRVFFPFKFLESSWNNLEFWNSSVNGHFFCWIRRIGYQFNLVFIYPR